MRSALVLVAATGAGILASFALAACSGRTADVEPDYTDEVERICGNLCEKIITCVEPPLFETEQDCRASCTNPEETYMYDDSACGKAFREYHECVGGTATCEEYLDTKNVHAEDYTCKEEGEVIVALACGASEGND